MPDMKTRIHEIFWDDGAPGNAGWVLRADTDEIADCTSDDVPLDNTNVRATDAELLAEVERFFGSLEGHIITIVRTS